MAIIKIDDTTVAKVGMQEVKQIFGSTELAKRKKNLEEQLAEVNELIDVLNSQFELQIQLIEKDLNTSYESYII